MAKKKDEQKVYIDAPVIDQPITETLEQNFMPYAMSVIISRAIPEIDGFKPSHRKLLYTMYKMGLLNGNLTKSANIVGQTMRLNPHGDAAIYETMVRLSKDYEALLTPFVESKGNFGKVYSRDMAYAASRYTEAKLAPICAELFRDIDKECVDFMDNYDSSTKEPTLLPTTFPNVLVSANLGIAVGMASQVCGFNLAEVCKTTVAYIKNPKVDLYKTLPAPDFPTGGELLYEQDALDEVYNTGRGSIKVRARWRYDKDENLIEVYEIPYSTTIEAIIDKVVELCKTNKLREITDIRDETGRDGLKIAINLKRGTDPEEVMKKLFRLTPLQDSYPCNFNILVGGTPKQMGVREILDEWCAWRYECVRRRVHYDLRLKKDRLHLLKGLEKILLDIDKAIKIIRETEEEDEVIPNLMIGFRIDEKQAEYIAEIRLRNINKQYILRRISETSDLEDEVKRLEEILGDRAAIMDIIVEELKAVEKKYGTPRKTGIITDFTLDAPASEEKAVEDYPVSIFLTGEGYFKKITPQSLRMASEQRLKEGDELVRTVETSNAAEVIFLTNRQQAYKCRMADFEDTKASALGDYLPAKLGMDPGENVVFMFLPGGYTGNLMLFFENGKAAKIAASAYDTKSNRRRLTGAFSGASPLVSAFFLEGDDEFAMHTSDGRVVMFSSASLMPKTTRSTIGVQVLTMKKARTATKVELAAGSGILNPSRYRTRTLPSAGAPLRPEDIGQVQSELDI